jgi:hypothetical protein
MRSTLLALSLGLSVLPACADDGGGTEDIKVNCDLETRDDDWVVGLTKPGSEGVLSFEVVDTTIPAVYDNRWVIQVNQTAGTAAPVENATLQVTPFMPDHGHLSPIDAEVTAMPTAGQYELSPIYLSMPGMWEVTIQATAQTASDSVVFRVCAPN